MKTPKRCYKTPAERLLLDLEPDAWEDDCHVQEARWTRKNRTARLKRSLHKYKHGTMLYGQFDLYLAYRWLQRLKKPNADADSSTWEYYHYKLRAIRGVLVMALEEVSEAWEKALDRENRKEQSND